MKINRYVIKVGGESGQGINTVGEILLKILKRSSYSIFGYREYPSLIKGGVASFQIDIGDRPINSSSSKCNVLLCLSRGSVKKYLFDLNKNGILIHNLPFLRMSEIEEEFITLNSIEVYFVDTNKIIKEIETTSIVTNSILLGALSKYLRLDNERFLITLLEIINKEKYAEINKIAFNKGLEIEFKKESRFNLIKNKKDTLLMTGNEAIALGAFRAGVRAFFSYPMTPSSSILTYLSEIKDKTKMIVRQVDDEITAAQMMAGAMFMGTRALTATSGGGFDLMSETVSMLGMIESPGVFILGQRPGPATGLPTWTSQSDLNLAIHSGHGEYPKIVISISSPVDAMEIIFRAFNLAEVYQIPVIVLTDKLIAESHFQIESNFKKINIERGLTDDSSDRYSVRKNGMIGRWLPGEYDRTYVLNSDEHLSDGSITEDSIEVQEMFRRRMDKLDMIKDTIPEPEFFGANDPDILFVGWGSTKNVMIDYINISDKRVGYLHWTYLYPFKTGDFLEIANRSKKVVLIENNFSGQIGNLIQLETGFKFKEKILKFDGRPFFIDDLEIWHV